MKSFEGAQMRQFDSPLAPNGQAPINRDHDYSVMRKLCPATAPCVNRQAALLVKIMRLVVQAMNAWSAKFGDIPVKEGWPAKSEWPANGGWPVAGLTEEGSNSAHPAGLSRSIGRKRAL